jgi:4a-hydroxytetrahydrobiopterin dehydratase
VTRLLTEDDVAAALRSLSHWEGDTGALRRTVSAPDFMTGIRIVDDVAVAAEELDHHPGMDIRWRKVMFSLSTHSQGGVTERDVELARRIDDIAERHGAR